MQYAVSTVLSMGRRKGEMTPNTRDREYPHQVAMTEDASGGENYEQVHTFANALSVAPRGHAFCRDGIWHTVFCFRERADAEKFQKQFGGEWFDPARRGRGKRWHLLREPKKKHK
jgi:hypothetical protein